MIQNDKALVIFPLEGFKGLSQTKFIGLIAVVNAFVHRMTQDRNPAFSDWNDHPRW